MKKWGREGEREGGREGESHSVSKSVGQELPIRETMQGKKKREERNTKLILIGHGG